MTFDFSTYDGTKSENHNTVETMTEREKATLRIAQVVAALNGTNIKVEAQFTSRTLKDGTVEDLSDKNGYYDAETDTIHINLNGTNSVLWTISHELTHRLAQKNVTGYTELHDAIKSELTKESLTYSEVQTLEHSYQIDKLQEYLNKGMNLWDALVAYEESRGYKDADAEEEVIARCCEQFLAKTTFVNGFASKHYKTARSISAFLTRMNADMQQLVADVNMRSTLAATTRNAQGYYETWNTDVSPEQDILNQMDALDDIARKWENAVKKIEQKRKAKESTKAVSVKASTMDKQFSMKNDDLNIVDLSDDADLVMAVEGLRGSEKYKAISKYVLNTLSDQPITLSDGTQAVVDKSDANHIASNAASKKTAQIAKIRQLAEKATLFAVDDNAEHNKFDAFKYYLASVRYKGEIAPIYLNVGHGKYDNVYHLYDITQKIRDTAHRINGVERARSSRSENGTSKNSIPSTKDVVKQEISSAKTSIKQIPALFTNSNVKFGKTNIDIGGGRFDLATDYLAERGTKNMIFDPYNRDEAYNTKTLKFLQDGNRADTATCANVLNVIAEREARANVILEVAKSIKPDGRAYFMVYEGDGSGEGRQTSAGYQNNRKTADYVSEISEYFDTVTRKGKLIIAEDPIANLSKASWEVTPGKGVQYSTQDIETTAAITDKEYEAKRDQYRKESAEIKTELQDVRAKLQSIEQSENYRAAFDRMLDKSLSDDEWKAAIDAFAKVEEESGHDALYKRQKELIEQQSAISKEWDKVAANKEQSDYRNAVKESGLTEAEYSRKQAVKKFGYTPYYYDAGYILPNGKMLNFSGEKGKHYGTRGQDHRAIGTIYPDSQGSAAMIRFMNDGNIRIMAETPGVDLCSTVEPTREQYATIRAFAESSRREEYFNVDLSDERGNNVGTLEYDGNVKPTRIINDIKHFYATGEVREQSSVSQFHYSTQDKDFHLTQRIGEQRVFEMRGTTANVYGSSVELEGGTLLNRVRMMQNLAEMYGSVTATATSEKEAQAFERAGAKREVDTFGETEYGTWAFEHKEDQYREDTQYDAKQKRNFADAVLKEVGTRKNFTKEDLRIIRARLEKAFAVLHNAWHGKGDQLVAMEYADKLFDAILNRKEKRRQGGRLWGWFA